MADNRDDFSADTIKKLCDRVGSDCSNPDCLASTRGPHSDGEKSINVGVAAHIHAASPGGKRYDSTQTPQERSSIDNGIWLCQTCAKLIDSDEQRFHAFLLREWRARAERRAYERLGKTAALAAPSSDGPPLSEGAREVMRFLRDAYVKAGFPNYKCWMFTPNNQDDPIYGELRALGLLYFRGPHGGPWRLTQDGVEWVMRNRSV